MLNILRRARALARQIAPRRPLVHDTPQLEIVQIPAGPLSTNAFIVIEKSSRQALIIDAPPDSLDKIAAEVEQRNVTPTALVITHGHWDHVGDARAVKEHFDIPLIMHPDDRHKIEAPGRDDIPSVSPDQLVEDGGNVTLGDLKFAVWHTPGHSPGQFSLYLAEDAVLFGGDTLFPGGYGTIEIADASAEQTVETIRRLLTLPDEVQVYTGHGRPTSIGDERFWMERVAKSGRLF